MKKLKKLFSVSEKSQKTENSRRILAVSCLVVVFCAGCLTKTSLAYFTDNAKTASQSIAAANYDVETTVEFLDDEEEAVEELPALEEGYGLNAHSAYRITLNAKGTATGGGYCEMKYEYENEEAVVQSYLTGVMLPGEKISFVFIPAQDGRCTFQAQWGELPEHEEADELEDGMVIGEKIPLEEQESLNNSAEGSEDETDLAPLPEGGSTEGSAEENGDENGQTPLPEEDSAEGSAEESGDKTEQIPPTEGESAENHSEGKEDKNEQVSPEDAGISEDSAEENK